MVLGGLQVVDGLLLLQSPHDTVGWPLLQDFLFDTG
jgi:hypothetical protein